MFIGLRTLIYRVPELASASKWYAATLGIQPYFDEPFYVGFNVAGYELGLVPLEGKPLGSTTYWGVENIEAAFARLLAQGAKVNDPIEEVGGGIKTASLTDPDGNLVGIIENPHFKLP
jgi:predicted enzyme related to lactoylglutathione lyase